METAGIIAQIDAEISRLQQARTLLTTESPLVVAKSKRGRPKGSVNKSNAVAKGTKAAKSKLSPEGRKAIADAMKRRWAAKRTVQPK